MKNYSQELFLLTTTLSQINSKDRIIRLFVESMHNIFQSYSFEWLVENNNNSETLLEVCTRNKTYGYFSYNSDNPSDPTITKLIHNSIQLLAIFIEKIEQENNLQILIDKRTEELSQANDNLEKINKNLQKQINAHTQTLKTLRTSEEKYKSLIDKVQTAIVLHDSQGQIIDSNQMANELLDYSDSNIYGKSLLNQNWIFLREDGTKMPISEYPVNQVLNSKKSVKNYVLGIRHQDKDQIIWVIVNAEPEYDENHKIVQVIVSFTDISERKKMNELFRQSQKMDAIGQLAGGVAHDFNNMLTGIIGAAQILKFPKRNLDPKGLEFVEIILDASKQAAELTNKLLTFGRKTEITSTLVDIHTVIDETIALLGRTIDKRIKLTLLKSAEQSVVLGDQTALQNSLLNMGINASHAMPDGGELQITTRNIRLNKNYCHYSPFEISAGDFLEIEIRDTGIGIAPEKINKIFEPFYTTKKKGRGTGLGLSTVYATVQNHHGAINIYSEVGVGSVFHIYLPCSGDVLKAVKPEEITLSGKGMILLVDDEPLIRITAKETLQEMGFTVMLAENGKEAVDFFRENHSEISLVVMDMLMPEMNGNDAFFKMKEIDKNCKVIISSGFTKDEDLNELNKAGLAGFIQKPFRDYELSKLLTKVLLKDE